MPVRITRVYTRTGDGGETALVGGRRIPKDAPRIAAYGTLDELNAAIGLARVFNAENLARGRAHRWLDGVLRRLQDELFDLGSELATPLDAVYPGMFRVGEAQVRALEALMDQCQADLKPLKSFVLPGGGRVGGFLHQARTVCRRAEREILALGRSEPIGAGPLTYVNRLSDLLFVLARWVGHRLGETEYLWERGLQSHARRGAEGERQAAASTRRPKARAAKARRRPVARKRR
jgi:cob(I)alamin adenosyltransferase